ncbi:uncharacterized protein LOC120353222 [Nilaparvata lugens]|uniref:uncharacterized protein LOC120353222 n=1 Tax=Nilaparvata lugens TaxID=108931 RepID=UPI00193E1B34|nr:uncharacterized protein LOC120353222 [Nilaparvata lugens]
MSFTVCSYKGCTNSAAKIKGLKMFRFSKSLSEIWIRHTGNSDLIGLSPTKLNKLKRVCEQHFRESDILPSGRLMNGAVPLCYVAPEVIPGPSHPPLVPESPTPTLNRSSSTPRKYRNISALGNPPVSPSPTSPSLSTPSGKFWVNNVSPSPKLKSVNRALFGSSNKSLEEKVKVLSTKVAVLRNKLASKRATIYRLKKQLKQKRVSDSQKFALLNFPLRSEEAAIVWRMQKHKKNQPWSKKEKMISTTLYLVSPAAYKFLKQIMIFPGISTIKAWISEKNSYRTGFNKDLMERIRAKARCMSSKEKSCVLMFDDMAIKQALEYSTNLDIIEGYQDIGNYGRDCHLGKQATVFMIRGLYYQWKLPVGYFITEKGLSGDKTKTLLLDCVTFLENAGLDVRAVVCDQCTTNRSAYKQLGVSPARPYFEMSGGRVVHALFDVPHLVNQFETTSSHMIL